LYELIFRKSASHCPGGVCEIRQKEPVQRFDTAQKVITALSALALIVGVYAYTFKVESKTHIGKLVDEMLLSEEEKAKREEAEFQKELKEFEEDDDF
jgi:hypothetical protein